MRRALAAAALTACALTSCASPRGGFAPSRDVCVSALPVAFDAVHDRGQLVAVHRLHRLPLLPIHRVAGSGICVFVFRGPFAPGSVAGSRAGGRYAVLLVTTTKQPHVVAVRLRSGP